MIVPSFSFTEQELLMLKKQRLFSIALSVAGVGIVLMTNGCGSGSFEKNSFGSYQATVPASYGVEPVAANGNVSGPLGGPFYFEVSGIGSPDGATPYLTSAGGFNIVKANPNATLSSGVDPNATGTVPLGFATGGKYLDAQFGVGAAPLVARPGASVLFRANINNGVDSGTGAAIKIDPTKISLSSSDPEWNLGSLPLGFNFNNTGPFGSATYVTGTPDASGNATPTPFALPFKTTGIHTLVLTVTDQQSQQTATLYNIPVVDAANVALLIQNIDTGTKDKNGNEVLQTVSPGDTVTIDGGPGSGVYPPTGYNSATGKPSQPTAAYANDASASAATPQGTIILFSTPGAHTLGYTSADRKTTLSQVLPATALVAGGTFIQ